MGKNTPPHSFLPCVCKRGGDLFVDLSYCFASLCVGLTLNTVLPTLSDHVFLLHTIPDLACNHATFRTCFCILDLTLQHRKVCFVITSVCRFAEELHAIRSRYQFQHLTNLEILGGIVLMIGRNQRPIITMSATQLQCFYNILRDIICSLRICLLYTSPSPRDRTRSRMPSSA